MLLRSTAHEDPHQLRPLLNSIGADLVVFCTGSTGLRKDLLAVRRGTEVLMREHQHLSERAQQLSSCHMRLLHEFSWIPR